MTNFKEILLDIIKTEDIDESTIVEALELILDSEILSTDTSSIYTLIADYKAKS